MECGSGAVITPILKVVDLNGNSSSVGIGTTVNYVLDTVNIIHQILDILKIILLLMLFFWTDSKITFQHSKMEY